MFSFEDFVMFRHRYLEHDHDAIFNHLVASGNNQGGIIHIFNHHVARGNRVEVL